MKKGGPKQAPADEGGEDDDKQLYRDRAEERRKGLNPDYDDAGLYSGAEAASVFVAPGLDKLSEEERKRIEIENSKYLGGDEKNTHRVKVRFVFEAIKTVSWHPETRLCDEPRRQILLPFYVFFPFLP